MDIPKFIRYHTNADLQNTFDTVATNQATNKQTVKPTSTSGASKAYFSSLIICVLPFLAYLLTNRA